MIKLYTDAATKGNPGPTGLGALVLADHQQFQLTSTVANCDNQQGEFAAAEFASTTSSSTFLPRKQSYFTLTAAS